MTPNPTHFEQALAWLIADAYTLGRLDFATERPRNIPTSAREVEDRLNAIRLGEDDDETTPDPEL